MASFFKKLFLPGDRESQADFASANSATRVRIATCAIMIEAARADDEFSPEEHSIIVNSLKREFALTDEEAVDLIDAASRRISESVDTWNFTNTLHENLTETERNVIIEEIWRIMFSDGRLGQHEDALIHKLAFLLGLTHQQMINAKMRIMNES